MRLLKGDFIKNLRRWARAVPLSVLLDSLGYKAKAYTVSLRALHLFAEVLEKSPDPLRVCIGKMLSLKPDQRMTAQGGV